LETPVGLFLFNRPETTARVVQSLRPVRPRRLFVVADGPRLGRPGESEQCTAARAVLDTIDWDCALRTNLSSVHQGVGRRVSSGIGWILDQVEEAIFLEDDCLPDSTFFRFCAELLDSYRMDDRVWMVTGHNPLPSWKAESQSYHFALTGCHWGWATWRRAWRRYDFHMAELGQATTPGRLRKVTENEEQVRLILSLCEKVAQGQLDAWDCQWTLGQLLRGGLAIVPAVNLVSNIGFGRAATHTREPLALTAQVQTRPVNFPLRPPPKVAADQDYDRKTTAWRLGRPDLDIVLAVANNHLQAGRHAPALLLVEAAQRNGVGRGASCRAQLLAARARAPPGLGRPELARDALDEARALVSEGAEVTESLREWERPDGR
jgi:hypothetical protein